MSISLNKPLDLDQLTPAEALMLHDLQGNILKIHGRSHATHVFLQFDAENAAEARAFIRSLAAELTSARQQLDAAVRFKASNGRESGGAFVTLCLSAAGYRALGCEPAMPTGHTAFAAGMKRRAAELKDDPHQKDWDDFFQDDVHAMLMIAHDTRRKVSKARNALAVRIPKSVRVVGEITGKKMTRLVAGKERTIEHFGYADGISQPILLQHDVVKALADHLIEPANPQPGLDVALIACPGGLPGISFGSFVVFRKLEQNVRGFKEREEALTNELNLVGDLAGAWLVGRFEDGTPVVTSDTALATPVNDFDYASDPHGNKCPFHAHVRKVNPRNNDTVHLVRRGITYGKRLDDPTDEEIGELTPSAGVGLLFISYQASIEDQFEKMQDWANDPDFPHTNAGHDPIIGQMKPGDMTLHFPPAYGSAGPKHKVTYASFVHLKGGEYFFAPCLSFLRTL